MQDVTFFKKDERGRLRQVPCNAPDSMILLADAATLKLNNQKNGWKGVFISHHSNGEGAFDPVYALGSRYVHIRSHTSDPSTYLSSVFDKDGHSDISDKDIRAALKLAASVQDYRSGRGIPIDRVDTHSLRIGGANAMSLNGYSKQEIQKMGQ
jgi:hypothetical protein